MPRAPGFWAADGGGALPALLAPLAAAVAADTARRMERPGGERPGTHRPGTQRPAEDDTGGHWPAGAPAASDDLAPAASAAPRPDRG